MKLSDVKVYIDEWFDDRTPEEVMETALYYGFPLRVEEDFKWVKKVPRKIKKERNKLALKYAHNFNTRNLELKQIVITEDHKINKWTVRALRFYRQAILKADQIHKDYLMTIYVNNLIKNLKSE